MADNRNVNASTKYKHDHGLIVSIGDSTGHVVEALMGRRE